MGTWVGAVGASTRVGVVATTKNTTWVGVVATGTCAMCAVVVATCAVVVETVAAAAGRCVVVATGRCAVVVSGSISVAPKPFPELVRDTTGNICVSLD